MACSVVTTGFPAVTTSTQQHTSAQRAGCAPLRQQAVGRAQAPQRRRRGVAAAASSSSGNGASPPPPPPQQAEPDSSSSIEESDIVFLGKLAAVSFGLGAFIKYGSLLLSLPFEPNTGFALALVFSPPLIWSAIKLYEQE